MMQLLVDYNKLSELREYVKQQYNLQETSIDLFSGAYSLLNEGIYTGRDNLYLLLKDDECIRNFIFDEYGPHFVDLCYYLLDNPTYTVVLALRQLELYIWLAKLDYRRSRLPEILKLLETAEISGRTAFALLLPLQLIAISDKKSRSIMRMLDCATHCTDAEKFKESILLAKRLGCNLDVLLLAAHSGICSGSYAHLVAGK